MGDTGGAVGEEDDEEVEVRSKPKSHIQQEWGVDAEDVERILMEAETVSGHRTDQLSVCVRAHVSVSTLINVY